MSLRAAAWRAGAPARSAVIVTIRAYRLVLSGWLGGQCRFFPSCSHYAEQVVREHGAAKGSALALWRIARCNPYGGGGVDFAPPANPHTRYDNLIPPSEAHA